MNTRQPLRSPGPDPTVCEVCGGRMLPPIQGRRTGLWIRSCRDCGDQTHTREAPPTQRAPTLPPRAGMLPFEPFDRVSVGTELRQRILEARRRA